MADPTLWQSVLIYIITSSELTGALELTELADSGKAVLSELSKPNANRCAASTLQIFMREILDSRAKLSGLSGNH